MHEKLHLRWPNFSGVTAFLQAAKAYAIVIAKTISHYSLYVCSCCIGQSSAYPAVASSVQVGDHAWYPYSIHWSTHS